MRTTNYAAENDLGAVATGKELQAIIAATVASVHQALQQDSVSNPPVPPAPRIGGLLSDLNIAWTGGSNRTLRKEPNSIFAQRPKTFLEGVELEQRCAEGLQEEYRLHPNNENGVQLMTWLSHMREYLEDRGLDTVFRVCLGANQDGSEIYLIEQWGALSAKQLKEWVDALRLKGVGSTATAPVAPCPYDVENLRWSFRAIRNSIAPALWSLVAKQCSNDTTGPELLWLLLQRLCPSDAENRLDIISQLCSMELRTEPQENVDVFCDKLWELCGRFVGTGAPSEALNILVAENLSSSSVPAFGSTVSMIISDIYKNGNKSRYTWDSIIATAKYKYAGLVAKHSWGPAADGYSKENEVPCMISHLTQRIDKLALPVNQKAKLTRFVREQQAHIISSEFPIPSCGISVSSELSTKSSLEYLLESDEFEGNTRSLSSSTASVETTPTSPKEVHKWCDKCRCWTSGAEAHFTNQHGRRSAPTTPTKNYQHGRRRSAPTTPTKSSPSPGRSGHNKVGFVQPDLRSNYRRHGSCRSLQL